MILTLETPPISERKIKGTAFLEYAATDQDGHRCTVFVELATALWNETYATNDQAEAEAEAERYSGKAVRHVSNN